MDSGNPGVETVSLQVPLTSEISFQPVPVDFGDLAVGVTSLVGVSNRVIVENNENQPVDITSSIVGPNSSDFSLNQQNTFDESNPNIVIDYFYVKFTPSGVGPRTATLVTTFGNIPLSGNGIPDGPSFTTTPPIGYFIGTNVVTWTNNGSTVLALSGAITGPDASAFVLTIPGNNLTIGPTGTIPFNISFTPSHVGVSTATLTVTDATSGLSKTTPLSALGHPQPRSVTPSSLTFGPAEIGVQTRLRR